MGLLSKLYRRFVNPRRYTVVLTLAYSTNPDKPFIRNYNYASWLHALRHYLDEIDYFEEKWFKSQLHSANVKLIDNKRSRIYREKTLEVHTPQTVTHQ